MNQIAYDILLITTYFRLKSLHEHFNRVEILKELCPFITDKKHCIVNDTSRSLILWNFLGLDDHEISDNDVQIRVNYLETVWNDPCFYPFVPSLEWAETKIRNENSIIVRLSTTKSGCITVTFYPNKHIRCKILKHGLIDGYGRFCDGKISSIEKLFDSKTIQYLSV